MTQRPKFFTSAPSFNDWLQIGSIKMFYCMLREEVKHTFGKGTWDYDKVDKCLCAWIVSIHEHRNHLTITQRKGSPLGQLCGKVWRQMGEKSHLHLVRATTPFTYQDFLELERKLKSHEHS